MIRREGKIMENVGVIIAVVGIGIAMVGVVISMMFWVRQESNRLADIQREDRKDFIQISRNMELTIEAISHEIKDFHARLLRIEERRK
jgi:hypothetical protein